MQPLEVHKFGGTSVADAARMRAVAQIVADERQRARLVVVSSATAGTTDALVALGRAAAEGDSQVAERCQALRERHLQILSDLGGDEAVEARVGAICQQIAGLLGAVAVTAELTPRLADRLLASGEKLAVQLLAQALRAVGIDACACDADGFLDTDGQFGRAQALTGVVERTARAALLPLLEAGQLPVVTGFCGRAPDGATTTLGRGGSDLSATLLAAALQAREVSIWTDVDGVYSADPRVVPDARVLRHLNYREAAEMSYYGAKVLHQRTMIPVQTHEIPVRTRNSLRPEAPGTVVDARFTPGSHPVKAVSAVRGQALLSIEGKGMAGVPGISARLFGALAARGISVTMISQSSSESSICLAMPESDGEAAAAALRQAFRGELSRGEVEEITVRHDVGLVAIVGLGMAHTPGVAGRAMTACGRADVNILAIAQGSSELNITLAVSTSSIGRALRALHQAFGLHRIDTGAEDDAGLDLILLGSGSIGRALVRLVQTRREHIRERFGLEARIVALIDRSGYLLAPQGLSDAALEAALQAKADGEACAGLPGGQSGNASEAVQAALEYRLSRPILVDVSDAEGAAEIFLEAFARGCDVVTANKKPLAGSLEHFEQLQAAAEQAGRVLKAEATVGAGLPVLDTLEILVATGDRLLGAEGCLSGTLGYVMAELQAGRPFSEAVEEARQRGFTEPDPVADLSGADVARKALILGRMSGLLGASAEVELEGLVPSSWAGMAPDALRTRLRELDAPLAARIEGAAAEGRVLRYVARVEPDRVRVGPLEVPKDAPAGRLSGSENLISFRSERYDAIPLVVTGPGAGVEVTAMGVLGDILRVAAERGKL